MYESELQERRKQEGIGHKDEPIEGREIRNGCGIISYVEAQRGQAKKCHYTDVHSIGCGFPMDEERNPWEHH